MSERTIRIKFDGSARGLKSATDDATKQIDKVKAKVEKSTSGFVRLGEKIGLDLTNGLSGAFKGLPPQVQAAAAAAAAVIGATMAGVIGAAITAGVLLAVSGGVLAAGIKAAANSPAVKSAWQQFGDRFKKVFADFGKPFEGPLIRAAQTFGNAIERMAPTFKSMGASMAPIIDKLAPAMAMMAEKALPGIKKAMEASKPLWDTLAKHLPKLGDAVSKFFEKIAQGGPGANKFLDDFLTLLAALIVHIGTMIASFAWLYEKARAVWSGISKVFSAGVKTIIAVIGTIVEGAAKAFSWIPGLGPKIQNAAKEFEKFRDRANRALDGIKDETVNVSIVTRKIAAEDGGGAHAHHSGGGGGRTGGQDRRASGGHVSPGRSYLVGENGPEVLTMGRQPGYITPNHSLGGVPEVRVFIGDRELTDIVRVEMSDQNRGLKRRALAGSGARR